jgi:hypothetical protein
MNRNRYNSSHENSDVSLIILEIKRLTIFLEQIKIVIIKIMFLRIYYKTNNQYLLSLKVWLIKI